jgi:hypothetical protein
LGIAEIPCKKTNKIKSIKHTIIVPRSGVVLKGKRKWIFPGTYIHNRWTGHPGSQIQGFIVLSWDANGSCPTHKKVKLMESGADW